MRPILFRIGRLKIYSFGTFIAFGAILAGAVMSWASKSRQLSTKFLFDNILYSLLAGLFGARVIYYITYQNQFRNFWELFYFWQGGLVAIGGLIAGFLVYFYLIYTQKQPIWLSLDVASLGLLVGWAIGKFGCHLSACSVGRYASGSFTSFGGYPVDLISGLWAGLVFISLILVWQAKRFREGTIFFLALEGLFLGELLIKTLKADISEGLAKAEAVVYLVIIVLVYLVFWRFHGPEMNNDWTAKLRQLVKRFKP